MCFQFELIYEACVWTIFLKLLNKIGSARVSGSSHDQGSLDIYVMCKLVASTLGELHLDLVNSCSKPLICSAPTIIQASKTTCLKEGYSTVQPDQKTSRPSSHDISRRMCKKRIWQPSTGTVFKRAPKGCPQSSGWSSSQLKSRGRLKTKKTSEEW